jgi:hypothetical protein
MTIPAEVINGLQKNGLLWEVRQAVCEACGREGVKINIVFVNTGTRINVAKLNSYKDAVDFISDLKKAGIIVS